MGLVTPVAMFGQQGEVEEGDYSLRLEESSSQYLYIADGDQTGLENILEMSVEMWVKFDSLPSSTQEHGLISKWGSTSGEQSYDWFLTEASGSYYFKFYYNVLGTSYNVTSDAWDVSPVAGIWYHYALRVDDDSTYKRIYFYINGIQEGAYKEAAGGSDNIQGSSSQVQLGNSYNGDYFDGWIAEARFWGDLRTETEIRERMNRRVAVNESTLNGYWRFGYQDGRDLTANGNDLSESGSPTYSTDVPFDQHPSSYYSVDLDTNIYGYITDGNQTNLEPSTEFSIEAWAKFEMDPKSAGVTLPIFTKWSTTGSECTYRFVLWGGITFTRMELMIRVGSTSYQKYVDTWTTAVQNEWYHLAVTCKEGASDTWDVKFYLNGAQEGSTQQFTDAGTINSGNADVKLGNDEQGQDFFGKLDDVRFWDVERSSTEIANNYESTVEPDADGLQGYWQFNGQDFVDATANDNDLTASGTPVYVHGNVPLSLAGAAALYLDSASSQYVTITDAAQTGLNPSTAFTIEAWVNFESLGAANRPLLSKWAAADADKSYWFEVDYGTPTYLTLQVRVGSTNELEEVSWSPIPVTGVWYHIAVTCKEGASDVWDVKFYVNGEQMGSTQQFTNAGTINDGASGVNIGRQAATYMDGLVDEVRFWDDERTATEIKDNFRKRVSAGSSNLQGYWQFDDGSLDDATSNSNDMGDGGNGYEIVTDWPATSAA